MSTSILFTLLVENMKEDQKMIYYVVGESKAQAAMSPALEKVASRGYEVIYVSEPVDEMTLQNIEKFMGTKKQLHLIHHKRLQLVGMQKPFLCGFRG